MKVRSLIIAFYLLLFLSVGAASAVFFWQTKQEYNRLQVAEAQGRRRLQEAQEKLTDQERVLQRLRTDPVYVEMVIRRRLGFAREDEVVYRFEP